MPEFEIDWSKYETKESKQIPISGTKVMEKTDIDWSKYEKPTQVVAQPQVISEPQTIVQPITPLQYITQPISKTVTGKSLVERMNYPLQRKGEELLQKATKEKRSPSTFEFFIKQLPASTKEALAGLADLSPIDIGLMLATYGIGKIPIKGTTVSQIAQRIPMGRKFLERIKELGRYEQTLKRMTPLSSRGIPLVKETPEMVASLRLSKFPEEVKPIIQQAQPIKPPVRSFAQQRATAEALKDTIDINILKPQDILNAEMRRASALKVIDNAKNALVSNKLEDMQAVYGQIQKLNNLHNEAGRLLGSLRDPLFNADDESIKFISEGLQKVIPESKESLAKFFKQATQPELWDKFMEFRTASLLTSPYTHERNVIGNIIGRLFKVPERVLSGGFDMVKSFIAQQPRERYATEAVADLVGTGRGIRLGIKNAFNALMNEDFIMSKTETRFGKAIPGVAGKIIRLPYRMLNAMDEFFSTWSKTSDIYSQAYRQALKEGAIDIVSRTAELIKKPTFGMVVNASEEALKQTFRQPLGGAGKAIQSALIKTKIGKFIVPFFRTPTNLFKWSLDRSPLGLYKFATPSFYKLPSGQMADEVGKIAFGQLISAGIAYEVLQKNITGRLSNDKSKREALQRQGIMPYSIKFGNKFISYRGFEPLASWIGLMANSIEQWQEKDKEPAYAQITTILGETIRFMREQPFLQGAKDLFEALDDPERRGKQFIQNLVTSSIIPTGVAYTARLFDPTIRETETIPQAIKSRLPYFSKTLPEKLDVWGRPITKEGSLMERAFNPAGVVTYKPDLTEQELLSLEKFPDKIVKKYRGLPLSIDERNIITKVEGGIIKQLLDKIIISSEYKRLDVSKREEFIDKIIRKVKTDTRGIFLEKKIISDLHNFKNREEKIKYIENLVKKKIIR